VKTGANVREVHSKKKDTFVGFLKIQYMTNIQLLEIIKVMEPAKRQEMALFLASPLFNRGKYAHEINRFYQIILDTAPDFSEADLSKARVSRLLFSDSDLGKSSLEMLVAKLSKLLRTFALMQQYLSENNEAQQNIDWTRWLRLNGLILHAQKAVTKLKGKKEGESLESLEGYRINLLLSEEEIELISLQDQYRYGLNLRMIIYDLDLFYHNYRSEFVNRYLLQQKVAQLPDLDILESGLSFYQSDSPLLQISQKIYTVLRNDFPTVGDFREMIDLIQANEGALSFVAGSQLYAFLRNACSLLINTGNFELNPTLHAIHIDNLAKGYFFVQGSILPSVYLNLVQVALRVREYAWAKDFTADFQSRVLGGDQDRFFYKFNMAHSLFAEGSFDAALDLLLEAPSNSHYHHMVRRLEIKLYYELRSDLLLYKMDAFRKFIMRTATKILASNLRAMDLNFLNILTQISQIPPKDKARSERLLKRIDAKKLLADRLWLIEKAQELS